MKSQRNGSTSRRTPVKVDGDGHSRQPVDPAQAAAGPPRTQHKRVSDEERRDKWRHEAGTAPLPYSDGQRTGASGSKVWNWITGRPGSTGRAKPTRLPFLLRPATNPRG
jgi:hypothetical protein